MHRIDAQKIVDPSEDPIGFQKGTDPEWSTIKQLRVLVDPTTDKVIGYWDDKFQKGGLISECVFALIQTSKKCAKSLSSTFHPKLKKFEDSNCALF